MNIWCSSVVELNERTNEAAFKKGKMSTRRKNRTTDDEEAAATDVFLPSLLLPSIPPPQPYQPSQNLPTTRKEEFRLLLSRGGVSVAVAGSAGRLAQLVIDISGVPSIHWLGTLRSFVADSWIVSSNVLATGSGDIDQTTAIVRALAMLVVKRALAIKQFGIVREIVGLFQFVLVAGVLLQTMGKEQIRAAGQFLREVAGIPIILYTALARLVVDESERVRAFLEAELKVFKPVRVPTITKGSLGRGGERVQKEWNRFLDESVSVRSEIQTRAKWTTLDQADARIREFTKIFQQ